MDKKFTENLTGGIRRFAMAGVGAIALTVEKSKEIIGQLAERGEATAADSSAACSDLQKKMTEQLNAFTQKLRADYENASFEQLVAKCRRLTPEQKAELIERMNEEPAEDEAAPAEEAASACCAAEEACEAACSSENCCACETEEAACGCETEPESSCECHEEEPAETAAEGDACSECEASSPEEAQPENP